MKKDLTTTKQLQKLQKKPLAKLKAQGAIKVHLQQSRMSHNEILLGDKSGSMGGPKINTLKDAIHHIMPNRPGMRAFLFGTTVREVTIEDVQAVRSGGSTHMYEALQAAWACEPSKIVLATDGEPTDADKSTILREAESVGVPICTLGIGQGDYDFDEDFLRRLAEVTGGTYDRVGDDLTQLTQLEHKIELLLDDKKDSGPKGGGAIQL